MLQNIVFYRQLSPCARDSEQLVLPWMPPGWVIRVATTALFPFSWQVWRIELTLHFPREAFALFSAFLKRGCLHHCLILNLNPAREGRTTSAGSHCLPEKFQEGASAYPCTPSNHRGEKGAPGKSEHPAWKGRAGTTGSRTAKSPESWGREAAPGGKGEGEGADPAGAWADQKENCPGALGAD